MFLGNSHSRFFLDCSQEACGEATAGVRIDLQVDEKRQPTNAPPVTIGTKERGALEISFELAEVPGNASVVQHFLFQLANSGRAPTANASPDVTLHSVRSLINLHNTDAPLTVLQNTVRDRDGDGDRGHALPLPVEIEYG